MFEGRSVDDYARCSLALTRYHFVDLLRGFAAIAVLLWHYQHFSFEAPGDIIAAQDLLRQPLGWLFGIFYTHGHFAVQFFWLISGFVFAAVYATSTISTRQFVTARFARLYPLHFITLLVVALLQMISIEVTGHSQIYSNNDPWHFVLNLAFASAWGLETGYSFNGPIWSVSIELLIYTLFWTCRRPLFRWGLLGPVLLSGLFFVCVTLHLPGPLWACGMFFFAGCAAYIFHQQYPGWRQPGAAALAALAAAALARDFPAQAIAAAMVASLVAAAWAERFVGQHLRGMTWIGDNTYSLYLWHVPVQIGLILVIGDKAVFATPGFLIAWLAGMMVLARASFLLIEKPLRQRIITAAASNATHQGSRSEPSP